MGSRLKVLFVVSLAAVTFIAGFATGSLVNGRTTGRLDAGGISAADEAQDRDYKNAAEIETMLGVIALEHAASTFSRSYGYQIRMNADRYIDANRRLTDLQVAERYPDQLPRIKRLREATERFSAALPEATMTHNAVASGYERETRAMLIPLERLVRQEMVGGDGLLGDFSREVDWSRTSAPIDVAKLKGYVMDATYSYWENVDGPTDAKLKDEKRASRESLVATLPALQEALREWPPEFSRAYEAHLDSWLKDWFGK